MANYIAVVHREPESEYGVSFPDFPGCITAGKTLEEAKDMAVEALKLHIKGIIEDGEKIPKPSKFDDIINRSEYSDAVAFLLISLPDIKTKRVRVNITIPDDILKKIDDIARKKGMTRSSFLTVAAQKEIEAQ